jgi:hypothetical protein
MTFKSIVPGWYSGRTIHIHVMMRTLWSSGSVLTECTTQLFLDQTLIGKPYSSSTGVDAYQRLDRRRLCCVPNYKGTNNLAVLPEPVHAFEI